MNAACLTRPLPHPFTASLLAAAVCLPAVPACAADDPGAAIAGGRGALELRYRFENVDDSAFAREANASTLRTRLRYTTDEWASTTALVEFDNLSRVGDDRYNDTRNGKGTFPVVADPDGTDLNQAYLRYLGVGSLVLTAGRQALNLDNQRFIGSVGWRQNEQALDGVTAVYKGIDRLTATWGYVARVNRVFGPDNAPPAVAPALPGPPPELDSDSHIVNLRYVVNDKLALTAYSYLLDFDNARAASSASTGLRATGTVPVSDLKLGYTAEYAGQSDYGDNPVGYDAGYLLGEVTFGKPVLGAVAGYEVLGSDSATGPSFQTPLATLHKFNGWADKFLATPAGGLVDAYAGLTSTVQGYAMALTAHAYEGDAAGGDYGSEVDASVAKTYGGRYTLLLKVADFQSDTAAMSDSAKAWLVAEAKF